MITVETAKRSLMKALSWRVAATAITTTLVFFLTGEVEFAAKVGIADTVIKFLVYFGHERIWNVVPYGRHTPPPPPEYQI